MNRISYQSALSLYVALFLWSCSGPKAANPFIDTTDAFLSELRLMQGDKNAFTPDTFFAPGGVICIVAEGKTIHCHPFGYSRANDMEALVDKSADPFNATLGAPVKKDSLFRLGSTSKLFVGLALAMCKDEGLVDYDVPVSKYIEELSKTETGKTPLTQLFTHSGGLPPLHKEGLRERDDEVTNATMADILKSAAAISPDSSKVGQFSYSNVGIILLAEAVSRVQELPYENFVKKEILEPLEMGHTYFHTSEIDPSLKTTGYYPHFQAAVDPDLQGYAPVGGMYSTGPDMAKLMALLQKALSDQDHEDLPISPRVVRDLTSVFLEEGPKAMGVSIDIGYRDDQTLIGHNGRINGYASYFTFAKEAQIGLVFMANGGFPLGRTSAPELLGRLIEVGSPE